MAPEMGKAICLKNRRPLHAVPAQCRMQKGSLMKVLVSLALLCLPFYATAQFKFGIIDPHEGASTKWQSLGNYFSEAVGASVTPIRYPPNRVGLELMSGAISFALVNPVIAINVLDQGYGKFIATLKMNGGPYFSGAIVARRDRNITTIADLKGKDVLAYQKSSAGGYVFQVYHLLQNGIDPVKDLKSLRHNYKQDDIVLAVQRGRIDAGFVRSGIVESLVKEGKIKLEDIVVIDEKNDELKLKHSTDLYPELCLLVSSKLDGATQERLQRAALSLRPDMPAARSAGIDGFVPPMKLEKVRTALRAVQSCCSRTE